MIAFLNWRNCISQILPLYIDYINTQEVLSKSTPLDTTAITNTSTVGMLSPEFISQRSKDIAFLNKVKEQLFAKHIPISDDHSQRYISDFKNDAFYDNFQESLFHTLYDKLVDIYFDGHDKGFITVHSMPSAIVSDQYLDKYIAQPTSINNTQLI